MTAATVAAAGLALRDAPPGTFAIAESIDGPRFPNGYIPSDGGSADGPCSTSAAAGPLARPLTANRWWDSRIRVRRLDPRIVARFVASTETMRLPSRPEDCIGWGPGLTPAADDVVIGMLAAFHATGARERVVAMASSCSGAETVPFSRSLIDHAVDGRVVRPLLDLLAALDGRMPLDPAVAVLHRFGSTSGRHLLDGVSRVLVETRRPLGALR